MIEYTRNKTRRQSRIQIQSPKPIRVRNGPSYPVSVSSSARPSLGLGLGRPSLGLGLGRPSLDLGLGRPSLGLGLGRPSLGLGLCRPSLGLGLGRPCLGVLPNPHPHSQRKSHTAGTPHTHTSTHATQASTVAG